MKSKTLTIPLKELKPDPKQPRSEFNRNDLIKLKNSIADQGILNPITVEPKENGFYLIVDGERRYRCAKELGLKEVPVNVLESKMEENERDIMRFQLQETHSQWSCFEKAEAMYRIKKSMGLSDTELAHNLAIAQSTVFKYLSILEISNRMKIKITESRIPFTAVQMITYINKLTSDEIRNKNKDIIDVLVDKLETGKLRRDDLRIVTKLTKANDVALLTKFYKNKTASIRGIYRESGLQFTDLENSVETRAKNLLNELELVKKNKVELNEICVATLNQLQNKIKQYI